MKSSMRSSCVLFGTFVVVVIATFLPGRVSGQAAGKPLLPTRFNLDPSHSSVGFAVRFMGLSTVRGAFSQVSGTVMYYEGDPARSSASVRIETASINTNGPVRDKHLRSPDFFDVEKYPAITFRSTAVTSTPVGLAVKGDLSMHGVTKQVTIPFTQLHRPVKDAWGNSRVTFQGGLKVKRQDYGIKGTAFWNNEFDPGRMGVSDDVDIELLVSADVPNPLRWTHPVGDSIHKSIETDGLAAALTRMRATWPGATRLDSIPEFTFADVGEKLIAAGKLSDAVRFYETIVALRPDADATRFRLAEAYLKSGKRDRAIKELERVARAAPEHTATAEWLRVLRPR